jgi:hypothetical protein
MFDLSANFRPIGLDRITVEARAPLRKRLYDSVEFSDICFQDGIYADVVTDRLFIDSDKIRHLIYVRHEISNGLAAYFDQSDSSFHLYLPH